ncbi:MAG: chemotaxis protein CheW [Phycisphaerae bacterium]
MTTTMEATHTGLGGKYLTFALGKEEYGLAILKVREIIGYMEITAVPQTASYVKGVLNLRGQVIAVIDLRSKFNMQETERTEETCIIVAETEHEGVKRSTGIIVDRVSEVLSISQEQVEQSPAFSGETESNFILGIAKVGKAVKILLDIDAILATEDVLELVK